VPFSPAVILKRESSPLDMNNKPHVNTVSPGVYFSYSRRSNIWFPASWAPITVTALSLEVRLILATVTRATIAASTLLC
jgi:hypothetical protein